MRLSPKDFFVHNEELCLKYNDYFFVFFYTDTCIYCKDVLPSFNKLQKELSKKLNINFAFMNAEENNKEILHITRYCKTHINCVPFLILFGNGKKLAVFHQDEQNPLNNEQEMRKFLTTHTQDRTSYKQKQPEKYIPAYSIGIPANLISRKTCSLFEDAYKTK